MNHHPISIRPFLGAINFETSRAFYSALGFSESIIDPKFSYFYSGKFGFYLQDAYIKDWIDNTMVFMEVDSVIRFYEELKALDLPSKFAGVRLTQIRVEPWGKECFLHDPSGILWHFGEFNPTSGIKKKAPIN